MTIALGVPLKLGLIECKHRRRVDRIDPILLIDRLTENDAPLFAALFEKVEEAAGTNNIAFDAVHTTALRDRHLGLGHRPLADNINARAA